MTTSAKQAIKKAGDERPSGRDLRIVVLRARFNARVVDGLLVGAQDELAACGVPERGIEVIDVPGAFELPQAAALVAKVGIVDAIVALGAVIKGETDHYEHIARECAAGLAVVGRESGVPVSFGVLTVQQEEHALSRSGPGPENKGAEAARAGVAMALLARRLRGRPRRGASRSA
jgi:6,7-dimethyl-8-ribityllumazine synthase